MSVIPRHQASAFEPWIPQGFNESQPLELPHTPGTEEDPEFPEIPAAVVPSPEPEPAFTLPTAEDIERIHTEAHSEGFREGFAEGLVAGRKEGLANIQEDADRVKNISDNLQNALTQLDQHIAEDILTFSLDLARQLLKVAIPAHPEALLPIIREAVAALPLHHGTILLHVNPHDAEMVRTHFSEQLAHAGWRLLEDAEIEAGGCSLSASHSEIDASIATRWRKILESIGAHEPPWLSPTVAS